MPDYDMKTIQQKILSVFIEIDKVCQKNKLRYFAIGGTCLGAIRHKGFIPWDDDLDIAMPREDYERFLEIADRELPSNLKVYKPEDYEHYECIFCKVHDINTTFIQSEIIKYRDRYTGVYVDIMPLDGVPENYLLRKLHCDRLQFYGDLNINRRRESKDIHSGIKRVFWDCIKKVLDKNDFDKYFRLYTNELMRYSFDDSPYTFYGWSQFRSKRLFPIRIFSKDVIMPFEDYYIRCPVGYDEFLRIMFGEYMELPKEKERIAKHPAFIDLERSYLYYQEFGIPDRNS